mgnify:CR=1 FL=1
MANIIDYIEWRGDLSFSAVPFNDIDALILCQISYLDFSGIVSERFKEYITLDDAASLFRSAKDFSKRRKVGAMINSQTVELLFAAASSKRFGDVKACGYTARFDLQKEEQFSATTFLTGDKHAFVAFRGTDDTIIGWKEDFNMGVLETVPAQTDALGYLTGAMKSIRGRFRVGGHSKGGNLAIYAGANIAGKFKKRIACVYNNDGPGFREETVASPEFRELVPKIRSFYPQLSIVGMLFSHAGSYTVVESEQSGIMQHDPFSWHLTKDGFVSLSGFDPASKWFHDTFNAWFLELPDAERSRFVTTLFKVLEATDAKTNSELEKNWWQNSAKIVGAFAKLDGPSRDNVIKTVQLLFQIGHRNLPAVQFLQSGGARAKAPVKSRT